MRPTGTVFPSSRLSVLALALLLPLAAPLAAAAQSSSSAPPPDASEQTPGALPPAQSSSSSSGEHHGADAETNPVARPEAARIAPGGAAVTLETSEPLFQMAAALNACGYDADLAHSAPVRLAVRSEMDATLAESDSARASRDALCGYITAHQLGDAGLNVGQYVSLALYLSPAPALTPNVDETQLPPQATQVVNVLPLLRTFAQEVGLHLLWIRHRPQYEALVARVHDPMAAMILNTNIFLHQPVSSYDGRRFLVLLEPMLSPELTNARIYGTDYIIVTSPDNATGDPVRMSEIRHIYLHYLVEPLVYSRGSAMERIQPMLASVQDAPLEFFYKSDVAALITECLIKALEARMYVITDAAAPPRPANRNDRIAEQHYEDDHAAYEKQTGLEQQVLVGNDERQGWVLTGYFYTALGNMLHNGDGLNDEIAPMIYGMDVQSERHHAESIAFAKSAPADPLRPAARTPHTAQGLDLAELDLSQGKLDDAADLADKAMANPGADHGRAEYTLARVELLHGHPEDAVAGFQKTLTLTHDPRTLAWSHIYLGRLYDAMNPPDRQHALAEYKQALQLRDSRPDTRLAAQAGLDKPFTLPLRPGETAPAAADDATFDPTGKAQKDAYHPSKPQ